MNRKLLIVAAIGVVALFAAGALAGHLLYRAYPVQVQLFVALTRNTIRSWGAPPGETRTELNPAYQPAAARAEAYGRGGLGRRRRRLAELQQDARLGPLRAARRDQRQDRRQAQGLMHLRHQTVYRASSPA